MHAVFDLTKRKSCVIFCGEVDVNGGTLDDDTAGDCRVKRTTLESINQLDHFDNGGNIKVLMTTNRPDMLDPKLIHPGRLHRKIEFGLPDVELRATIFKAGTKPVTVTNDNSFDRLSRLRPNATVADIQSVVPKW